MEFGGNGMSDRTWNPIDARLYEENWSQCAKLVAGVMLARCPNQYGIFDIPEWFLRTMFEGLYAWAEIEGAMVEWEAAEFVKFYDDRRTIWVVKKWKREQKNPSDLNFKGMFKFLQGHNKDLARDFIALYVKDQAPYKGLIRGLLGGTKGILSTDTDTESESESEADTESDTGPKKKKEPPKSTKPKKEYPQEYIDFVDYFFDNSLKPREKQSQLDALDKLIRLDGFKKLEVFAVLRACKKGDLDRDGFKWSDQVKSFVSLRSFVKGRHANKMHNLVSAYGNDKNGPDKPRLAFGGASSE